jgi:hypothetical protein
MSDETNRRIRLWWGTVGERAFVISKAEWDELDAAIRADERARLRALVEGMREKASVRRDELRCYDNRFCKAEDREFDALSAVLALLTEEP